MDSFLKVHNEFIPLLTSMTLSKLLFTHRNFTELLQKQHFSCLHWSLDILIYKSRVYHLFFYNKVSYIKANILNFFFFLPVLGIISVRNIPNLSQNICISIRCKDKTSSVQCIFLTVNKCSAIVRI